MAEELHFLHIEDNLLDAELIEAELRREWPDCVYLLISTESELAAALGERVYDVVLSDYSLPGYSGMDALAYVRQQTPQTPFIFVTGTLGEEMAIETLKSGASDYVLKLSLVKMVPAIQRALQNRQAEAALLAAQCQLLQSEKLATIGLLAAGVAHEINNPMSFFASNMAMLQTYIEKYHGYIDGLEEEIRSAASGRLPEAVQALRQSFEIDYVRGDISALIEENMKGLERIKQIVHDLKIFSRVDTASKGLVDLDRCLESTINIVSNEIKYVAVLKKEFGTVPLISSYAQQLSQVFMNLLINAVQAIRSKGGEGLGEIQVHTWCDETNAFVAVTDNGCGIVPQELPKIFDPFYTTKEVGQGTGLGLSISDELIRKEGGEITVVSEVGVGSTFTVRLPLVPAPAPP